MVARRREPETAAEIATRTGRAPSTVAKTWTRSKGWPAPIGKRGRWSLYDSAEVDAWLAGRGELPDGSRRMPELEPDRLYTAQQLEAAGVGVKAGTIRADLSQGRWPAPDDESGGAKRWLGRTVSTHVGARRPYPRRARED